MTDEYGNAQPSTTYELHCVDASGVILKKDAILYAFTWIRIIAVIGFGPVALLAFLLAAPVGRALSKLFDRRQKSKIPEVIEPT